MTFDEFNLQLATFCADFASKYLEGVDKNPEHWPLEMSEPDWYEQFLAHLNAKVENE